MANIHYIKAAIRENTGYEVPLGEVVDLLLEENMITLKQARQMVLKDYSEVYSKDYDDYNEDLVPDEEEAETEVDED